MKHLDMRPFVIFGCLLTAFATSVHVVAQAPSVEQGQVGTPSVPYLTLEVIVRPLFQQGQHVEKVYETYDQRLEFTQSVMDQVKYRLGNKLVSSELFDSRLPLDIKFELVRFDIVSNFEFIDAIDQKRSFAASNASHAISKARLIFEKDGEIFTRNYKLTKENHSKYSSGREIIKELLANSLESLIETMFSDEDLVAFLKA